MTDLERARLLEIRLKSKRGGLLTGEEHVFCRNMFNDHSKEYKAMNAEITRTVQKDFDFS